MSRFQSGWDGRELTMLTVDVSCRQSGCLRVSGLLGGYPTGGEWIAAAFGGSAEGK